MPYEDLSAQYPSMKGIAVELPFVKFKYVKVEQAQSDKPKYSKQIDLTVPSENRTLTSASRVMVTREAEVTTLGMDTMISFASVIHELAYGRISADQGAPQTSSYPVVPEQQSHSLDIII